MPAAAAICPLKGSHLGALQGGSSIRKTIQHQGLPVNSSHLGALLVGQLVQRNGHAVVLHQPLPELSKTTGHNQHHYRSAGLGRVLKGVMHRADFGRIRFQERGAGVLPALQGCGFLRQTLQRQKVFLDAVTAVFLGRDEVVFQQPGLLDDLAGVELGVHDREQANCRALLARLFRLYNLRSGASVSSLGGAHYLLENYSWPVRCSVLERAKNTEPEVYPKTLPANSFN